MLLSLNLFKQGNRQAGSRLLRANHLTQPVVLRATAQAQPVIYDSVYVCVC